MPAERRTPTWWRKFWIALALIPLGGGCWLAGLGVALGDTLKWIEDIANVMWGIVGPALVVIGVLWLIALVAGPILFPQRINRG